MKHTFAFLFIIALSINIHGQESLKYFISGRDKVNQQKYQSAIGDLTKAMVGPREVRLEDALTV